MSLWTAISVGVLIGSFIINHFLKGSDHGEQKRPKDVNEWDVPRASEGAPVPVLFGRARINGPNILWFGEPLAEPIEAGGDVVGYRYAGSFTLALCHPCSRVNTVLHGIWAGDRKIFSGTIAGYNVTEFTNAIIAAAPVRKTFYNANSRATEVVADAALGDPGVGGGLSGEFEWQPGAVDQQIPVGRAIDFYELGTLDTQPAYRGLSYLHFSGYDSIVTETDAGLLVQFIDVGFSFGEGGSLPNFSAEMRSYPNALGYSSIGDDANPAEVIYAILTDTFWGMGRDAAEIDTASFQAAAATLETEGNGFSLLVGSVSELESTLDEVKSQIAGVLYEDLTTRKIGLKLIRDDYNIGTVQAFDETNVEVDQSGVPMLTYTPTTWASTYNEIQLSYTDRASGYVTKTAFAQSMAAIGATGRPSNPALISYPGCTERVLANKLATRDLRILSLPLARLTMTVNRDAVDVQAGDVIAFSWSDYGLSGVAFRVLRVNPGTRDDSRITLECMQDHYKFGESIFPEPVRDLPIVHVSGAIDTALIIEAPRWLNSHDMGVIADPDTPRLLYLAKRPASGTNDWFNANASDDDGATFALDRGGCPFRNTALVETAYAKEQGPYDTTVGLRIKTLSNVGALVNIDSSADIYVRTANLCLVGGELLCYESYTDEGGGVYTLENVNRAMLDTVPADHAVDADVWFLNPQLTAVETRNLGRVVRSASDSYIARMLAANAWGAESIDDAADYAVTTVNRAMRPMPVDDLLIDSLKTGTLTEDYIDYAWRRRLRETTWAHRGLDVDMLEAGDEFRAGGRIVGDGAYSLVAAFAIVSNDINAAAVSQPHGLIGHGDAELRVTSFRNPYDWNTALELENYQHATWDFHLARYRQLLANPSFVDGTSRWVVAGTTPLLTADGVRGRAGSIGNGNGTYDYTVTQDVDVRGWATQGLTARLRGYRKLDSANSQETSITALDSSLTPIGTAGTTGADLGTAWELFDVTKTLPAGTEYLRIVCESVDNEGSLDPIVSDLDLRLGQMSSQLLANPDFDANITSWTVLTGSWAVNATNYLVGGGSLNQSAAGTGEIYQEQTIPAGFELGTAHLQLDRRNYASDQLKVVLEARNSGGTVIVTTETGDTLANDGEYHVENLYLDLDDATITDLRVRVVSTVNGIGTNSMVVDAMRLHVHKELHPTKQHTVMTFDNTPIQVFPERAIDWVNDYAAPEPSAIYTFDETSWPILNKIPTATPSTSSLTEVGASVVRLGQTCAGFRDAAESYAFKSCMEARDGSAGAGGAAKFPTIAELSLDGANSWSVTLAVKAFTSGQNRPLIGSLSGGQGWRLVLLTTGGVLMGVTTDTTPSTNLSLAGTDYGDGTLHYVTIQYDAGAGTFAIWSDSEAKTSRAVPSGDATNLAAVYIGGDATTDGPDAQYPCAVRWDLAASDSLTKTHTDAWWAHATDPSGELTQYESTVAVAGPVDSDSDGVIVGAYSAGGQVAIFEDAALTTHGRGISAHRDLINLVDPDPIAAAWTNHNGVTVTDRAGVDAMRMYRAVEIAGTNTQWLKSAAITKAAGDVTVVAYVKADNPASGLSAFISITDSADNTVSTSTFAHSTLDGWTRIETTRAWSGVTSDLHVAIGASNTGSSGTIQLSMPIGVYYGATGTTFAPIAIHLADSGGSNKAIIRRDTALDARYNHEGEVSVTGVLVDEPSGISIADIGNGTNSNDRRLLEFAGSVLEFSHYDGAGATVDSNPTEPTWTDEWTVRGRWNTGGIMEDAAEFAGCTVEGVNTDYGRGATWTPSAVALDDAIFGDDMGGLISEIVLAGREFGV